MNSILKPEIDKHYIENCLTILMKKLKISLKLNFSVARNILAIKMQLMQTVIITCPVQQNNVKITIFEISLYQKITTNYSCVILRF